MRWNDCATHSVSSGAARQAAFHRQFLIHIRRDCETAGSGLGTVRRQREVYRHLRPGCVFLESVSNPILRVADIPKIAAVSRAAGAALVVDNTFACPMLMRPLDMGANIVVHSATKYLAGHGDVLGGIIVSDADHHENVRMLSRIAGGTLGPFESYLTMRGI